MKSGIYKIINKINGKCYIGSSSNLQKRNKQHFNSLSKNKHYNQYLQRSFNKYGISNFEFIIICKCNEDELINLEQYYINKIKPEYNAVLTAGKTTGYKFTEEQRKYQSESRGKTIVRIDLYTKLILDEWKSAKIASNTLNLGKPTAITACCKNKIPSAYGFIWRYKNDSSEYEIPIDLKICQRKDINIINKAKELYAQNISISKISKQLGISYHTLYYHLK